MIQIMESNLLKTGHSKVKIKTFQYNVAHFVQVSLNDIQYEDICKAINLDLSATGIFL